MRKRGFVVLASTAPVWIFAIVYDWHLYHQPVENNWHLEPWGLPLLLEGAQTAAVLLTLTGLCLLSIDFVTWLRSRAN